MVATVELRVRPGSASVADRARTGAESTGGGRVVTAET